MPSAPPLSSPRVSRPSWGLLAALSCVVLLAGCPAGETAKKASSPTLRGVNLKLLVVDDPAMAAAIGKLRGEWHGQTDAAFEVASITSADLADPKKLEADALICPSAALGDLCEADQIVPVPQQFLRSDDSGWGEVFSLLRSREAAWGGNVMAVPFGSAMFVCYYRADLLEALGRRPPRTWEEYQELAALLADRGKLGKTDLPADWRPTAEPLAPGWAANLLLARVAAYANHPENDSALFDSETREPLVDKPPFVRALKDLIATLPQGSSPELALDPAAVRRVFWEGECGMAITWPSASEVADLPKKTPPGWRVGFVELPGSPEAYNFHDQAWAPVAEGDDSRVPLLAFAGRLGVVTRTSKTSDAAFQLLFWLSNPTWSRQVSPVSPATTLFRKSHLQSPQTWSEPAVPTSAAASYATLVQQALSRSKRLFVPRLPGRGEYLGSLDAAVGQAVRRERTPEAALTETSKRWQEITDRRGRDRQKQAYWHSLGLD
jgi:multiple sugar transport system substrate-binding protein